jgi:purine-nucleoside phosphorylase
MSAFVFNALPEDVSDTVIMPGDPLRAKYIAENYLEDARQITDVRNMLGFTGRYKGRRITVVGHGIGIPSATLYCSDLILEYGVKRIFRVGSCGTISKTVKLRDLVIAMGASTDSNVNRVRFGGHDFAAIADYTLLEKVVSTARKMNIKHHISNVFTSDYFYPPKNSEMWETMGKYNVPVVEMEIAGIYGTAAEYGAAAVAMCTVSDDVLGGKGLTVEERQSSFDEMIKVALSTVAELDEVS